MNHDTKTSFLVFLFVLGALTLSQRSNAALSISPTVSGYGGGMLSSPSGGHTMTPANDGYIKPTVVNVGAKQITVPATMRMAANAGNMAKQGMRLTPLGIIGTLAAGWLLQEGMEYINGEWNKNYTGPGAGYTSAYAPASPTPCTGTPSAVVSCVETKYAAITGEKAWRSLSATQWQYYRVATDAGITLMTVSVPGSSYEPATQDDWDALPDPLPDVAEELPYAPYMAGGVPVDAPEYEFTPFQAPVGDPYTKPDGSTSQPMASVSPNGDSITIDTYDMPVTDAQGNPIPSPTPQDTTEPTPDSKTQCDKFPNSLGCSELGTVDDLAVGTESRSIAAITPVTVGGTGSCPEPLTADFMGETVSFSYDMPCSFATSLKPLILAIAWLSAGLIFIGGVRQ